MTCTVLIAGSGGQGVLMGGRLLAEGAMAEGRFVTWFPSYGAARRGGDVNCTVVMSDSPVDSPVATTFDALVVMDERPLLGFQQSLRPGGLLVMDSSKIGKLPERNDIRISRVPVMELCEEKDLPGLANMVLLGALIAGLKTVSPEHLIAAMKRLGIRDFETNRRAFILGKERGFDKKSKDI